GTLVVGRQILRPWIQILFEPWLVQVLRGQRWLGARACTCLNDVLSFVRLVLLILPSVQVVDMALNRALFGCRALALIPVDGSSSTGVGIVRAVGVHPSSSLPSWFRPSSFRCLDRVRRPRRGRVGTTWPSAVRSGPSLAAILRIGPILHRAGTHRHRTGCLARGGAPVDAALRE